MRRLIPMMLVFLALATAESDAAQGQVKVPPIRGYPVVLKMREEGRAKGELVAVNSDSLWLLRDHSLTVFPMAELTQVDIQQSSIGGGKVMLWSVIAGVLSGALLSTACSSVEDAECSSVLPVTVLTWAIIGGVGVAILEPGRYEEILAPSAYSLRPYSRFPQGMPEEYRRARQPRATITGDGARGDPERH